MKRRGKEHTFWQFTLPLVLTALLWWGVVVYIIIQVDPEVINVVLPGLYLPFVMLIQIASWVSFYLLFKSMVRALMWSLITALTVLLSFVDLVNIVNVLLLTGLGMVGEYILRHGLTEDDAGEAVGKE